MSARCAALAVLVSIASLARVAEADFVQLVTFGGELSDPTTPTYYEDVTKLVATDGAFAMLTDAGAVTARGDSDAGGSVSSVRSQITSGVTDLVGNRMAFCAIKDDGSVVTWPSTYSWSGGDSSAVADDLVDVEAVYNNDWVFVAVKSGGGLVAWGDDYFGASIPDDLDMSQEVTDVVSTRRAFAVLRADGSVVTWGHEDWGGDSSNVASDLTSGVTSIVAAEGGAFAAIKDDGSVVTWGNSARGGDSSGVQSELVDVVSISSTFDAFAAITDSGTAVAWGDSVSGGNLRSVADVVRAGVTSITSNRFAFAALKADGSIKTWGDPLYGGDSYLKGVDTGVEAIYSTAFAFAALKSDGAVLTWGNEQYGGSIESVEGTFLQYFNEESNSRCKNNIGQTADNTLQTCARRCARGYNCRYFSFNWDTNDVTQRCTLYRKTNCDGENEVIAATSQTLYQRNTTVTVAELRELSEQALLYRNVQEIYSNDWSFLAVLKSGIAQWGAEAYGGAYDGTYPSGSVEMVVPNRVGYGILFST
ncbi:E3 ubiquitin-protein ligase HERC2 [Hondaea fermentalgiana]|uniref:E3 ubiquitin-protein ligase HERC2 n=1 Tax=Hondaea fermentalgiana TaxID=2315210 RepID=A0A2R5GI37_9STRA|nr:E3 ubiquitin-protein ligase HERC2 [Hondaea fermentalgiana]|eukprot:GBG30552.1 E3 ubiquitin-protein ligase HERC2 [Hondaea fermentalgiana]